MVRAKLGQLAQFCMETAQDRRDAILHFQGMAAFNLSPKKLDSVLSDKLRNWFMHDFDTFRGEVISSFGVDIPANDLQLWTDYFNQEKTNVTYRKDDLTHAEQEVDTVVYELFGLDDDEIALIEAGR
jgi:hypothetical protein